MKTSISAIAGGFDAETYPRKYKNQVNFIMNIKKTPFMNCLGINFKSVFDWTLDKVKPVSFLFPWIFPSLYAYFCQQII